VYNWVKQYLAEGPRGLEYKSTRPHTSPGQTPPEVEALVLDMRDNHPAWGARKIKHRLDEQCRNGIPSVNTVNRILKRNGRIEADEAGKHTAKKRFACERPNDHWQMDFKGHFSTDRGRCHPLTVLDDCSRYNLGLRASPNERCGTVKESLVEIFRRYGLPDAIVVDNGPPWAVPASRSSFTDLAVWLIRLGIRLIRITEYHPQTNGKVERFHRSLVAEVLQGRHFRDLDECQEAFDDWRYVYNFERPHEACGNRPPCECYEMSPRNYPETLPELEYGPGDRVRKVQDGGLIHFKGKVYKVGRAFKGLPVAVRPTGEDGVYDVFCVRQKLVRINESGTPLGGTLE
jgi:transposase InsO family protein